MNDIYVKDGNLFVMPNIAQSAENIISKIQNLAIKTNATKICLDLSGINMFTALKIALLTSTYGLTQSISKKYEILVDNEITMSQIKLLSLSNLTVYIKQEAKTNTPKLVAVEV